MDLKGLIGCDVLGTCVDASTMKPEQGRWYRNILNNPVYEPLEAPVEWLQFPAWPDVAEGLERLRKHYMVVTCSNLPHGFTAYLCKHNGLVFDGHYAMEVYRTYKTAPAAYMGMCKQFLWHPSKTIMITSNEDFGDIEAAKRLHMQTVLIDRENKYPTALHSFIELAKFLGC